MKISSEGRFNTELVIENREEMVADLREKGHIVVKTGSNKGLEPFFIAAQLRETSDLK